MLPNFPLSLWILLVYAVILSVVDVLTFQKEDGGMPSFLSTIFLLFALFGTGLQATGLIFAVVGGLLWLLYTDIGAGMGLADLKVLAGMSAIVGMRGLVSFLGFMLIMLMLGLVFFALWKKVWAKKYPQVKSVPYIPVLTVSFLVWLGLLWIVSF